MNSDDAMSAMATVKNGVERQYGVSTIILLSKAHRIGTDDQLRVENGQEAIDRRISVGP